MSRIFNKSDECLVCQVVNYCKTFYVDSILNKCLISFIKVMWGGGGHIHKLVQWGHKICSVHSLPEYASGRGWGGGFSGVYSFWGPSRNQTIFKTFTIV